MEQLKISDNHPTRQLITSAPWAYLQQVEFKRRYGVMAEEEKLLRCKISIDTVYNTLKTHTKYAHSVCDRSTLKDVERFRYLSVGEPYQRSLFERTLKSEPFIEKHALSTELSNVNREQHKRKSHRVCRRDREPSRIPIRSLKSLRKKSRKVRELVYARILSYIPMPSILYCYVKATKLLNKTTFQFNCHERVRKSKRKKKYYGSRYLRECLCKSGPVDFA